MINLQLVWNIIRKLQRGSLFFITRLILVGIWSESLPKCGSTIIKFFLGTVLTTFRVNALSKISFICICQRNKWATIFIQNTFEYIYFMIEDGLNITWITSKSCIFLTWIMTCIHLLIFPPKVNCNIVLVFNFL